MRVRLWTRLWWVPVVGCLAAAVQAAEEPILQLETGGHTAVCTWVGLMVDLGGDWHPAPRCQNRGRNRFRCGTPRPTQ